MHDRSGHGKQFDRRKRPSAYLVPTGTQRPEEATIPLTRFMSSAGNAAVTRALSVQRSGGEYLSHKLPNANGPGQGRSFHSDNDWYDRELDWEEYDHNPATQEVAYVDCEPNGHGGWRADPRNARIEAAPWRGRAFYITHMHGNPNSVQFHLKDPRNAPRMGSGRDLGKALSRRRSLRDLRNSYDNPCIVLVVCETAGIAQAVADRIGLDVYAPTAKTALMPFADRPRITLSRTHPNAACSWRLFRPR
jgi:hypothetical protein